MTAAVQFVLLTHPHPKVEKYVSLYARALHATLNGACLRQQAEAALKSPTLDAWDTCQSYMRKAERYKLALPSHYITGIRVSDYSFKLYLLASELFPVLADWCD